ncbi:hypothetical protein RchiOBHm_Chr7g0239561 [Rosa chinensis]|uniref:Uncharacterized protein n=1 Tax=Rosa chinensis TaxID=74649 RepID=A0A2P6PHR3_ROSCH|nr:hypothetical protein RchiOBHm_Chr7g0239561 [Rosa chinensis]
MILTPIINTNNPSSFSHFLISVVSHPLLSHLSPSSLSRLSLLSFSLTSQPSLTLFSLTICIPKSSRQHEVHRVIRSIHRVTAAALLSLSLSPSSTLAYLFYLDMES